MCGNCVAFGCTFFSPEILWHWSGGKRARLGNPTCHCNAMQCIVWPWFCRILMFYQKYQKTFFKNTVQKCPQKYCGIGREAGETWKSYLPALSPPGAHRPIHCTGKIFRTSENQLIYWKSEENILKIYWKSEENIFKINWESGADVKNIQDIHLKQSIQWRSGTTKSLQWVPAFNLYSTWVLSFLFDIGSHCYCYC